MRRTPILFALGLLGCEKPTQASYEGPMPVSFGDCAAPTVAWVSGPRPTASTDIEADAPVAAAAPGPSEPTSTKGGSFATLTGIGDTMGAIGTGEMKGTFGIGRIGTGTGIGPAANANGALGTEVINRYVRKNVQKIKHCYTDALASNPELAGVVKVEFFISPTGTVDRARGTGLDPKVAACVADVIKAIEFPRHTGAAMKVSYPFTFSSADSGTSPELPMNATLSPVAPAPRPPAAPVTHEVGVLNPLRGEHDALVACLRHNPQHAGVVVIELGYDGAGKVTRAEPHGLTDEPTRACMVEIAMRTQRPAAGPSAQRCSLAFGELPANELPTIDIAKATVTFAGKPIALGTEATLPALATAVEAGVKAPIPVVAIRGPIVIRPDDAAPMQLVNRAMASVIAASGDFVLSSRAPGGWQLMPPMALPVVPVPVGTGSHWHHLKRLKLAAVGDERVVLSLLVTTKQVWIGLSRVNEFQEIVAGPDQLAALVKHLQEHKQSAFFASRTDVEIAGADDVPYGDVVKVIGAAERAGFTAWTITDERGLAARPSL